MGAPRRLCAVGHEVLGERTAEEAKCDFCTQTVTGVHAHRFVLLPPTTWRRCYYFGHLRVKCDKLPHGVEVTSCVGARAVYAQLTATFFLTRVNIQRETLSAVFTAKTVSASSHTLSGRNPRVY